MNSQPHSNFEFPLTIGFVVAILTNIGSSAMAQADTSTIPLNTGLLFDSTSQNTPDAGWEEKLAQFE